MFPKSTFCSSNGKSSNKFRLPAAIREPNTGLYSWNSTRLPLETINRDNISTSRRNINAQLYKFRSPVTRSDTTPSSQIPSYNLICPPQGHWQKKKYRYNILVSADTL